MISGVGAEEFAIDGFPQFALLANKSRAQAFEQSPSLRLPDSAFAQDSDARKSYVIPAAEIVGFDFLVNRVNEHVNGHDYEVTSDTIKHNLRTRWVTDNDPFSTNQFFHPYQGSMYHGFARSAGLGYWESSAYTFAGSALWEIAGENTPPSKNDQIASGIAGSFLGEPLFRMANLLLENGDDLPKFWRELAAATISPATGFNRLAFGDRFDSIFPSYDPAYYSRFQIGANTAAKNSPGASTQHDQNKIFADYAMDYGLPGKPGYRYERPFDYFYFNVTSSSADAIENLVSRGLLYGTDYQAGNNYRGVWGIYGSYDYLSPQLFSVSSTALSLGTTAQWWLSQSIALQGSVLGGTGYTAVSTLHGTGEKDYHYGISPQAQLILRLIFDNKAAFDLSAREYYVNGNIENRGGHDNIARADASFTVRVCDQHAIGIKYVWTQRDATYSDLSASNQKRGEVALYYAFIGGGQFGTVDWRK
ncbi:MAG TPA: DUF3943 domain-containing protein [Spongiibacteraceae bacterium]